MRNDKNSLTPQQKRCQSCPFLDPEVKNYWRCEIIGIDIHGISDSECKDELDWLDYLDELEYYEFQLEVLREEAEQAQRTTGY